MKRIPVLILLLLCIMLASCGPVADKVPSAPANVASVAALIKGKKFSVKKVGLSSAISSTGTSVQWIDETVTSAFEKQADEELKKFSVEFVNDNSVIVLDKDKKFEGSYVVDDNMDEYDKEEGIKIRLTYVDPNMSFGGSEPMEITYTYPVKGAEGNKLLLQFPREINRQPVVGLLDSSN